MTEQVTKIKLFVASPGDVLEERNCLTKVRDELNYTYGNKEGFVIEIIDWRTHCNPAMGRTQGVINVQVGVYDIFLGIMWKRFGTPTGVAESGTKEEFDIAYEKWKENNNLHILFYFSQAPYTHKSTDEIDQHRKVLDFRDELKGKMLDWEYPDASEFADTVRPHIARTLFRMLEQQSKDSATPGGVISDVSTKFQVQPETETVQEEEPLTFPDRNVTADSPEIVEIREQLKHYAATGEPIANSLLLKADLKCDDGERISIDYLQFDVIDPDPTKLTFSNENQPVPWKFLLILNLEEGRLQLTWGCHYNNLNVKRELEGLRFQRAMSKGGELSFVHLDSGFRFQKIAITAGVMEMPDKRWMDIVEKLNFIQQKVRIPIHIPNRDEEIQASEIREVFETVQKLETGQAFINIQKWESKVGIQTAKNILAHFESGKPQSFSISFEHDFAVLLGNQVPLGPVVFTCEQTIMTPEDISELKAATQAVSPSESIPVRFKPVGKTPMIVSYLDWLPLDKRDFIVNQMNNARRD